MGHAYVLGDALQGKGSTEITPIKIVIVGCADEQTSSKGLPKAVTPTVGVVFRTVFSFRRVVFQPVKPTASCGEVFRRTRRVFRTINYV